MQVQAVLFSRKRFLVAAQARDWLRQHGYGGTIVEDDPEVWEFEQAARATFHGRLSVEPAHGHPGVSFRVVRDSASPETQKARAKSSPSVDYAVLIKEPRDSAFRVQTYRQSVPAAKLEARKLAATRAADGKFVAWRVETIQGKVLARGAVDELGHEHKSVKRVTKKAPTKRTSTPADYSVSVKLPGERSYRTMFTRRAPKAAVVAEARKWSVKANAGGMVHWRVANSATGESVAQGVVRSGMKKRVAKKVTKKAPTKRKVAKTRVAKKVTKKAPTKRKVAKKRVA